MSIIREEGGFEKLMRCPTFTSEILFKRKMRDDEKRLDVASFLFAFLLRCLMLPTAEQPRSVTDSRKGGRDSSFIVDHLGVRTCRKTSSKSQRPVIREVRYFPVYDWIQIRCVKTGRA